MTVHHMVLKNPAKEKENKTCRLVLHLRLMEGNFLGFKIRANMKEIKKEV